MNSEFKLGDGTPVNFEKTAEVVKYNGGTLKAALDLMTGLSVSAFGRRLLQAQDVTELQNLLQVSPPLIYDEAEFSQWGVRGNPSLTSTNAKFGTALEVSSGHYIYSANAITFGGNPFTLSLWAYIDASSRNGSVICQAGNDISIIKYTDEYIRFSAGAQSQVRNAIVFNNRFHLELAYDGAGRWYFGLNGAVGSVAATISRAARTIVLGGAVCCIDEFRLLDGVCLHTSGFTPPTAKYSLTDETKVLLHFD